MAGYRRNAAAPPDGGRPVEPGSLGHAPVRDCHAIMTIGKDFQDLIRAECPRCQAGSGACLVRQLREAAGRFSAD